MTKYRLGAAAFACAIVAAALALVAGAFGGGSAQAALAASSAGSTGTLTIEGLQGASGLEVQGYSWGVTNPATVGGGGGAGKATFSDLVVTRPVDSVSPKLVSAAATGQHFDSATLDVSTRKGVMRYTFDLVLVTGVEHSGSGDTPVEKLTLTYGTAAVQMAP